MTLSSIAFVHSLCCLPNYQLKTSSIPSIALNSYLSAYTSSQQGSPLHALEQSVLVSITIRRRMLTSPQTWPSATHNGLPDSQWLPAFIPKHTYLGASSLGLSVLLPLPHTTTTFSFSSATCLSGSDIIQPAAMLRLTDTLAHWYI